MFDSLGYKKRTCCAICGNKHTNTILDYGPTPLAGEFLNEDQLGKEILYPLSFEFCSECSLFQTDSIIDPDILFKDYRYLSSIGLSKHFEQVSQYLVDTFGLDDKSSVLDIGANDGVLLRPLMNRNINAIGIDPAINITQEARNSGCSIITDYFNSESVQKHFEKESFDVITCMNCFAHIDDIHEIVRGVKYALKPHGHFVIEVHYIKNLIDQIAYDNLYAEHIYEYSLNSLRYLFNMHGMTIVDFEELPVHAGSIRVIVSKASGAEESAKVKEQLRDEKLSNLTSLDGFISFSKRVQEHSAALYDLINDLNKRGKKIIGYGASGRANILSHVARLDANLIQYIVDESPERYNRYLSKTHIPIYDKKYLDNDPVKPDYILIFAWNFSKMIIGKLQDNNYTYIIPFPVPHIVSSVGDLQSNTL
jgi:SAM-dependent methyltransferase